MTIRYGAGAGVVLLAAAAMGAATFSGLRAQNAPGAYVVIDISETMDVDAYVKAVSAAEPKATLSQGGRFIIRSNSATALDGGAAPNRFVVIAFDSVDKAKAWNNSEAIRNVNVVRMKATKSRAFVVEGLAK